MTKAFPPWLDAAWNRISDALRDRRLSHALLIAGDRGLGKRALVERMIARLLCMSPKGDDACGQCRSCVWLAAGTHSDFARIGMEEGSSVIKVDQVRDLIARVQLTGQVDSTRVVVIDPADAMNVAAQNALLKTLEEPAAGVHLVLVADVPARLLATVRSRCRTVSVAMPSGEIARRWLQEAGGTDDSQALALAAGHPGAALMYAEDTGAKRARIVAEDLCRLADADDSALAVAKRWTDDAPSHIDDAIAWLRVWAWRTGGVELPARATPNVSLLALTRMYADALRLRERLQTPLKPAWLLHEWLVAWTSAAARRR